MSLLDDLRRIADEGGERYDSETETWECPHCTGRLDHSTMRFDHTSPCPWLSMPKIVAALEAIYELMQSESES